MTEKKNIVKYSKPHNVNIGLVIFLVIVVYIAFNIFQYSTSETIAAYEVTQGSIAANNTYRGLILRHEKVFYSNRSGYVNYYVRNGSRVSVNDVVCSIDTKGDISQKIISASSGDNVLSVSSLNMVSEKLDSFMGVYDSVNFSNAISFKDDLSSTLLQMINSAALDQLGSQVNSAASNNTFYLMRPDDTGIVAYYIDEYEDITIDEFRSSLMNPAGYSKQNLKANEKVEAQAPVFKMITDEAWDIVIPISEEQANSLAETNYIKIRFCEDGYVTNAKCSVITEGRQYFLNLHLNTAMIRYVNDRYIDIDLVVNEQTGLKIPKSSITSKDFFTVPKEAFSQGKDSKTYGLLISKMTEEGEVINFITPTIYYETEEYYYIDDEDVTSGDVALINNSSRKYTIGSDVNSLIGVYNINKGYAVFKQINIIYENEDYAVVEQKTAYGVSLYDHIALDGSKLIENQLIIK